MLVYNRVCWGGTKVITSNYSSKFWKRMQVVFFFFLQTYSHVLKHLSAGVDRRDLLSWQDRTDVFSCELLRGSAHPLLLAVPPQPHHGGQVLHCAVVHAARQMRELPLNILTFWGKKTKPGGKKLSGSVYVPVHLQSWCSCVRYWLSTAREVLSVKKVFASFVSVPWPG